MAVFIANHQINTRDVMQGYHNMQHITVNWDSDQSLKYKQTDTHVYRLEHVVVLQCLKERKHG